jgi:hypothetical protein
MMSSDKRAADDCALIVIDTPVVPLRSCDHVHPAITVNMCRIHQIQPRPSWKPCGIPVPAALAGVLTGSQCRTMDHIPAGGGTTAAPAIAGPGSRVFETVLKHSTIGDEELTDAAGREVLHDLFGGRALVPSCLAASVAHC